MVTTSEIQSLIDTPNLGPVTVSQQVIRYLAKQRTNGDNSAAEREVIEILQSSEIEQLVTPISSPVLEFWVHRSSSMVFTALMKEGYRLVSMASQQSMEGFVFDGP